MFGNNATKWIGLLVLLFFANIAYYFYNNWGLVTVKVKDVPLEKVISSIEWQGWVKIYTNLPLDTKVTMFVDHVPLAEAMETLAANVDVPPPPSDGTDSPPANASRPDRPGGLFGGAGGLGGPGAAGAPGGPPGGRGGGFGGRAQWNLAFFIAPTSAQVKQEILAFQTSDPNDDNKVYTYGTQVQMIASENVSSAPDPRLQAWPGVQPVDPSATPAPALAQANTTTNSPSTTDPADPPAPPLTAVQQCLQDFAQSANIWIMAPGSWTPDAAGPPPPNSSIIRAVENFVSNAHGAVTQAIILRAGRGGARGGNPVAFGGNDDAWADRMRNAINGLPPDERADATDQLNKEVDFRKKLQGLPPDQRRQMMLQHFAERMLYGDRSRLSPEKRAKAYQRLVAMRAAAKAQK
jgi:hypothetical protein